MKKLLKFLGLTGMVATASTFQVQAQDFYTAQEYGVAIGASHYFGDLNPNYGFKYIRPNVGLLFKQHFNPYISVSAFLNGTQVGYNDTWSDNAFQRTRNLSFQSTIVELGVAGEFNFFWFDTGKPDKRFTPYLTLGIAGFYSNPTAELDGRTIALKKLGTEGQNTSEYANRKYSSINVSFPIGAGIKTWIVPGVNFAFEIANRFTTTDYIDDVSKTYVGAGYFGGSNSNTSAYKLQDRSVNHQLGAKGQQRGDEISFDQYLMAQIKISFQLKTYKCPSYRQGLWEP